MTTYKTIDTIEKEGYLARLNCVKESENPYSGLEGLDWLDGWNNAEEDHADQAED